MVNVLVIGATGYIGQALCQSLVRSGAHRVFGLARTPEKARSLYREEVIPILGSITENTQLLHTIDAEHINVVVDVSGANQESHILLTQLKKIGAARVATGASKLGFIYCSGTWVHGSSNEPINDLMPVDVPSAPNAPPKLVAWRPKLEREVLSLSDVLDVMVIRPALVYGRSSAIWSLYFDPIRQAIQDKAASVSLLADTTSRPGLIHVDDVASGFHAAIDRLPTISGSGAYPVFDLVTSQESMADILKFAALSLGFNGEFKLTGSRGQPFPEAMNTSFNGCSGRARQILGWEPKRFGFVQNIGLYAEAFIAAKL